MLIFTLAVLLGILFRYFGVPSIIGHVLAGLLVGFSGVLGENSVESLRLIGTAGVTLLLFLIGLEMNWTESHKVLRLVFPLFLLQTLFTVLLFGGIGFWAFGFTLGTSLLFSLAMSFCSTIVIVKILSEKKELTSLSGRLSLGVLLLQDMLAIAFMIWVSSLGVRFEISGVLWLILKLTTLFVFVYFGGKFLISGFMKYVVKSSEDLILLGLSWLLIAVYVGVNWLQLVPEVAGFVAGLSLASYWGHVQLINKIKTIRDIFLTIFFVLLGLQIDFVSLNWSLVILILLAVVLGKFLITFISARIVGLGANLSFGIASGMTQVSEFSLVVMSMGYVSGIWSKEVVTMVSVAGLLSMVTSTWIMMSTSGFYKTLKTWLPRMFNLSRNVKQIEESLAMKNHIVLIGADRTGKSLLSYIHKLTDEVVVVDFNPQIVESMVKKGIRAIFADATDPEVLEITNMREAKMIISTVKDINDTLFLLKEVKSKGIRAPMIVDAESSDQANELYKEGADYVIYPHFVSGYHLNQVIKKYLKEKNSLEEFRNRQSETLNGVYG